MALQEMYDYLSSKTADYTATTLNINPQGIMVESGEFNQIKHEMDDNTDEVITVSDTPYFEVELQWTNISNEDAGTIIDFFFDTAKGKGMARSFQWAHIDGHTYVVKFASAVSRELSNPNRQKITSVKLKVIGYV